MPATSATRGKDQYDRLLLASDGMHWPENGSVGGEKALVSPDLHGGMTELSKELLYKGE